MPKILPQDLDEHNEIDEELRNPSIRKPRVKRPPKDTPAREAARKDSRINLRKLRQANRPWEK